MSDYQGTYTSNLNLSKDNENDDYSVDRVNSNMGYTVVNCVSCCETCNTAKNDMSLDDWNSWLDRISSFRKKCSHASVY